VRKLCKKLTNRFVGPFPIIKSVNPNTYEVNLPKIYGKLHRTFPVSLLKPYSRKKSEEPPEPVNLDIKKKFLVKSIRKERVSNKETQFLVKWLGYPEHENIWEPLKHLDDCEYLVEKFRMRNERVKHAKRSLSQQKGSRKRSKKSQ
jgi:hypothetical protein